MFLFCFSLLTKLIMQVDCSPDDVMPEFVVRLEIFRMHHPGRLLLSKNTFQLATGSGAGFVMLNRDKAILSLWVAKHLPTFGFCLQSKPIAYAVQSASGSCVYSIPSLECKFTFLAVIASSPLHPMTCSQEMPKNFVSN